MNPPAVNQDGAEDFLLLVALANGLEGRVEGRACAPLEEDERRLLDRMSIGECNADERADAIELVLANSEAMDFLAGALME